MAFTFVPRPQSAPYSTRGIGAGAGQIGQGIAQIIFSAKQDEEKREQQKRDDLEALMDLHGSADFLNSPSGRALYGEVYNNPPPLDSQGNVKIPFSLERAKGKRYKEAFANPEDPENAELIERVTVPGRTAELLADKEIEARTDLAELNHSYNLIEAAQIIGANKEAAEIEAQAALDAEERSTGNLDSQHYLVNGEIQSKADLLRDNPGMSLGRGMSVDAFTVLAPARGALATTIKTNVQAEKLAKESKLLSTKLVQMKGFIELARAIRLGGDTGKSLAVAQGLLATILAGDNERNEPLYPTTQSVKYAVERQGKHWWEDIGSNTVIENALEMASEADRAELDDEIDRTFPEPEGDPRGEPLYTPSGVPYWPMAD